MRSIYILILRKRRAEDIMAGYGSLSKGGVVALKFSRKVWAVFCICYPLVILISTMNDLYMLHI